VMPLDTRRAHYEELSLVGAFHHRPDLVREAVALLGGGTLVPDGLITHATGLDGVPDALALMASGQALKVLIDPSARSAEVTARYETEQNPPDSDGSGAGSPAGRPGAEPRPRV